MTDGDTNSGYTDYAAYGFPPLDRRSISDAYSATDSGRIKNAFDDQINARYSALCTAVKNMNITLWVISYGSVSGSTATRLQNCASPGLLYAAASSSDLIADRKSTVGTPVTNAHLVCRLLLEKENNQSHSQKISQTTTSPPTTT